MKTFQEFLEEAVSAPITNYDDAEAIEQDLFEIAKKHFPDLRLKKKTFWKEDDAFDKALIAIEKTNDPVWLFSSKGVRKSSFKLFFLFNEKNPKYLESNTASDSTEPGYSETVFEANDSAASKLKSFLKDAEKELGDKISFLIPSSLGKKSKIGFNGPAVEFFVKIK